MRVFVTGATGFVGRSLVATLCDRGDEVVALSRDAERARKRFADLPQAGGLSIVEGDPCYEGAWQADIGGCDAVVNLAGEPVDGKRWDARFRQTLRDSRVDATRFVVEAMLACKEGERPSALINASGIDYYGFAEVDLFDEDLIDEAATGGESFLAAVCWDWEAETDDAKAAGIRVCAMRTGMVLGRQGGAYPKLAGLFRKGLGGRIGKGQQWTSWIHIADAVGAYVYALDTATLAGPINLAAPQNARNVDFAAAMGKVLSRPTWLPVPKFALELAVGQLSEYLLKGRRAYPKALVDSGYQFRFPELDEALRDLLN